VAGRLLDGCRLAALDWCILCLVCSSSRPVALSVVVPAYNEIANLEKGALAKIARFLGERRPCFEVIVVDDGSTDGSRDLIRDFAREHRRFRLIENPHLGKAGAVTTGVLAAGGERVLFTDMDQATPIEELEKLLPALDQGYEVAIGSRAGVREGAPLSRQVMARGMTLLRSGLVGLSDIADTQCGFKLFSRQAAAEVFGEYRAIHHGFRAISGSSVTASFDVEILYLARRRGYRIKEVPVEWRYVDTNRVNPTRDALKGARDLALMRLRILRGGYSR
jgi:dolichyl-phosphate beta-glucosyltransferase